MDNHKLTSVLAGNRALVCSLSLLREEQNISWVGDVVGKVLAKARDIKTLIATRAVHLVVISNYVEINSNYLLEVE